MMKYILYYFKTIGKFVHDVNFNYVTQNFEKVFYEYNLNMKILVKLT